MFIGPKEFSLKKNFFSTFSMLATFAAGAALVALPMTQTAHAQSGAQSSTDEVQAQPSVAAAPAAQAPRASVDEVVVTGSYIKHTPEDAPVPVEVIDSEELFNLGNPSVVELIKTLGISSGVDGETNQFQSNGLEGTANINLRGLGPGRNLVLLNGRRNVWSPYPVAEQQQLFVDINLIPAVALNRIEMLKDGAAATYGSDAISGVVNFITRSDFEGAETALSFKHIEDSDGDLDFGTLVGHNFGRTHVMASIGYNKRSELQIKSRDWAIKPFLYKGNDRGYSSIPNPGSFFRVVDVDPLNPANTVRDGRFSIERALINPNNPASAANIMGAPKILDPRCADFIGNASATKRAELSIKQNSSTNCTYNYTYFDNLIEEEERYSLFSQLTHEFSEDMSLNLELLFAKSEVPEWKTSPAYPPQTLVDTRPETGRFVPSYHPGLKAMVASGYSQFADYDDSDATCAPTSQTDYSCNTLLFFGRPWGISGPSGVGKREHETMRLVTGLDGSFGVGQQSFDYTTSVLWSQADSTRTTQGTITENWALAFRGFGGPNCTGNTPGENGCLFYNPFSNSIDKPQAKYAEIKTNPDYKAELANSPALRKWLTEGVGTEVKSSLTVFDAVVASSNMLAGLDIDWALGVQSRTEEYVVKPFANTNLYNSPCQTKAENTTWQDAGSNANVKCNAGTSSPNDDYEGTGRYIFLAGTTPFDEDQEINALFGETNILFTDNLEVQFSARYEDYGGAVGDSFDPKLAVRWQALDYLTLRASASTTFRGPTLNQLGRRSTSLSYVPATTAFKAVDTVGSRKLKPETANTANLGAIFAFESLMREDDTLTFSVDYWSFDFSDPIIKESFNDLINDAFNIADPTKGVQAKDTLKAQSTYRDRFTMAQGANSNVASGIQRIKVNMINGPDIETDGFDLTTSYDMDVYASRLTFALQGTIVNSFEVGKSKTGKAFDAAGKLNDTVSYLRPIVEHKAKFSVTLARQVDTFNLITNYTGEYDDAHTPSSKAMGYKKRQIEEHLTYDFHYNLGLQALGDSYTDSAVWLSFYNITDEDPPFARLDLNYDPYTHSAFGRMVKLGVRHAF